MRAQIPPPPAPVCMHACMHMPWLPSLHPASTAAHHPVRQPLRIIRAASRAESLEGCIPTMRACTCEPAACEGHGVRARRKPRACTTHRHARPAAGVRAPQPCSPHRTAQAHTYSRGVEHLCRNAQVEGEACAPATDQGCGGRGVSPCAGGRRLCLGRNGVRFPHTRQRPDGPMLLCASASASARGGGRGQQAPQTCQTRAFCWLLLSGAAACARSPPA